MNSKAIRKQLLAAVAMVLVAAVALGSSTYAWFANNSKVTATGMSVNAAVDDSLVIKGLADNTFGSVGTTTIAQASMKPATSSDGVKFAKLGNNVKVKISSSSTATWSGRDGAFQDGDLVETTDTAYIESATYTIKSIGSASKIYVSDVTVTPAAIEGSVSNDIYKALRVAVSITDSTTNAITKVYKPATDAANTDNKVGGIAANKWVLVSDTDIYTGTTAANIWDLAADEEYPVTIKVWFEGQDTLCFTDNVQTNGAAVTVEFTKNIT